MFDAPFISHIAQAVNRKRSTVDRRPTGKPTRLVFAADSLASLAALAIAPVALVAQRKAHTGLKFALQHAGQLIDRKALDIGAGDEFFIALTVMQERGDTMENKLELLTQLFSRIAFADLALGARSDMRSTAVFAEHLSLLANGAWPMQFSSALDIAAVRHLPFITVFAVEIERSRQWRQFDAFQSLATPGFIRMQASSGIALPVGEDAAIAFHVILLFEHSPADSDPEGQTAEQDITEAGHCGYSHQFDNRLITWKQDVFKQIRNVSFNGRYGPLRCINVAINKALASVGPLRHLSVVAAEWNRLDHSPRAQYRRSKRTAEGMTAGAQERQD